MYYHYHCHCHRHRYRHCHYYYKSRSGDKTYIAAYTPVTVTSNGTVCEYATCGRGTFFLHDHFTVLLQLLQ